MRSEGGIPPDADPARPADPRGELTHGTGKDVETMIDWESDTWGGTVHLAANGSWVTDKHPHDTDGQD
jgi:hypothetical protein